MSTPMQTVADQITTVASSHLGPDVAAPIPTLKSVARTLKHLAKQLTQQRVKQAQAAQKATVPTAKKLRKALVGELIAALQPHLGLEKGPQTTVSKGVSKTLKQLAAQLVQQQRKQTRQGAKVERKAAKQQRLDTVLAPVLKVAHLSSASNSRPISAARPSRAKPAAPKGSLASISAKKELVATAAAA